MNPVVTDFACRMENMAILYHSLVGETMAMNDLVTGKIHPSDAEKYGNIVRECREVFQQASDFPGVAEG